MELDFENLHLEARGVSLQLHVLLSDLGRAARGTAGHERTRVAQTPARRRRPRRPHRSTSAWAVPPSCEKAGRHARHPVPSPHGAPCCAPLHVFFCTRAMLYLSPNGAPAVCCPPPSLRLDVRHACRAVPLFFLWAWTLPLRGHPCPSRGHAPLSFERSWTDLLEEGTSLL
jgi:hypothetical protein